MIKSIVTDINILSKKSEEVKKGDNTSDIIKDLKDTLEKTKGWGISAPQIGIFKKISLIKIPTKNGFNDIVLINPIITEKDNPIRVNEESCLSFKGINVCTKRYAFIAVEYLDENMEQKTSIFLNHDAIVVQHEIAHLNGRTIFDDKWKAK